MKRNAKILSSIALILLLTGCRGGSIESQTDQTAVSDTNETAGGTEETGGDMVKAETETDTAAAMSEESTEQAAENAAQTDGPQKEDAEQVQSVQDEPEADDSPKEAPQLPETGSRIEDFVPDGWEIWDSVELDFNEDGVPDYVGVLQAAMTDEDGYQVYQLEYPRILFAIASEKNEGYRLDFQDMNVIRKRDEGGVFGDPYQPLTAEGTTFTTHTYGGSAWRWWEDYTYTYREGNWWLASSEEAYGYGDYITDYEKNDWENGVGIRKERSSDWGPMEENWDLAETVGWDSLGYDLEYEVPLDEQMTLEQAGKRWWLAADRMTDWEVKETIIAADVELSKDRVKLPDEAYSEYCDENGVLYSFGVESDTDGGPRYLAMYGWQDKVLSVLAQEASAIGYPKCYDGKIYYSTEIVENVTYRNVEDGKEEITKEADAVGVRLNRIEPDGTGKEVIFEYRYLENVPEIMENRLPYMSMPYEISGGEIVAEVYVGGEPHPFYRMKTDGSGRERIGQVPK